MDFDDPDPFVPVWEGPYEQARQMLARVEAAHIPVDLGDALVAGQARVEVPRSYSDDAKAAITGQSANWPELPPPRPGLALRTTVLYVLVVMVVVALVATLVL